jgi:hypothetical protein
VDGVQVLQVTDSFNVAASRHGLRWLGGYDWGSPYDNFSVRDITTTIDHVVVSPASPVVPLGSSQIFTAQAYDATNTPIPNVHFRWTSSASSSITPAA